MDQDTVRAVVITGVLATAFVVALPSPDRIDHDRIGTPGPLRELATVAAGARRALLRPLVPVVEVFGVDQGWGMFATPDRTPNRLEVHVERDGRWEPVFVKNRVDHPVIGPFVRDRRIRALYDTMPDEGSPAWWNLTLRLGRMVMERDPDVERVRVRLVQTTTTDPWEPADPRPRVRLERVHDRVAVFWDEI